MGKQGENTVREWYYVSIPYYGHRVFKCAGHGAEQPAHRAFYLPHFQRYGKESPTNAEAVAAGPYRVLILSVYLGDRITDELQPHKLGTMPV